jgi:3-oxoacyl-[acyl-carrier protein] reductase
MIDYGLSGKVALVTGVSRHIGIGAAIARSLAASGASESWFVHSKKSLKLTATKVAAHS